MNMKKLLLIPLLLLTVLSMAACGGDCARCDTPGIGKDTGGYLS